MNNLDVKRIKILFWSIVTSSSLLTIYSFLQLNKIYLLPMQFTHSPNFNPIGSLSGLTMFLIISLPLFIVGVAQIREISPKINKILAIILKVVLGIIGVELKESFAVIPPIVCLYGQVGRRRLAACRDDNYYRQHNNAFSLHFCLLFLRTARNTRI